MRSILATGIAIARRYPDALPHRGARNSTEWLRAPTPLCLFVRSSSMLLRFHDKRSRLSRIRGHTTMEVNSRQRGSYQRIPDEYRSWTPPANVRYYTNGSVKYSFLYYPLSLGIYVLAVVSRTRTDISNLPSGRLVAQTLS